MMAAIFIQPTFAQNDEKLFSGKPILPSLPTTRQGSDTATRIADSTLTVLL